MYCQPVPPGVRRTKILATVGPATASPAILAAMLRAGADGFRLNFSHGTDADHLDSLRRVHAAARRAGREIAIVADVQGPKIRIGALREPAVTLADGASWTLDERREPGDATRVPVHVPGLRTAARPGDPVPVSYTHLTLPTTERV